MKLDDVLVVAAPHEIDLSLDLGRHLSRALAFQHLDGDNLAIVARTCTVNLEGVR